MVGLPSLGGLRALGTAPRGARGPVPAGAPHWLSRVLPARTVSVVSRIMVTTDRRTLRPRAGRHVETAAQLKARVRKIIARLEKAYPDATCALHHKTAMILRTRALSWAAVS